MLAPPPRPLTRSRQKAVLLISLIAGIVEILGLMRIIPGIPIGRFVVSPSVVPALAIAVLLGRRMAGRARDIDAAAVFWIGAIAGLAVSLILLDREGHLADGFAIVVAALDEELIYRFAVPAVVAAVLLSFHVQSRHARVAGLVVAAVWFVLLPGHRTQVHDAADVLPFIAFAALAAIVVYRSGSLLATSAAHAVMNMLTIIAFGGEMTRPARSIAVGVLLLLLVTGYGFMRPRKAESDTGEGEGADTVIDLRDGVTPTASTPGGPPRPVLDPVPEDAGADAPG